LGQVLSHLHAVICPVLQGNDLVHLIDKIFAQEIAGQALHDTLVQLITGFFYSFLVILVLFIPKKLNMFGLFLMLHGEG
jgi:hypothetical protein